MRRHGRSRAFAANHSSNAETSLEFLVLGFEFKKLPNREIHEIREKEMKKNFIHLPPMAKAQYFQSQFKINDQKFNNINLA